VGNALRAQPTRRSTRSLASTMGVNLFIESIGLIAIGVVVGYAGLRLLGEYRKAFFVNPRGMMTLEVLFAIARFGGPGYLAMLCLIGAMFLVSGGIWLLILAIFETLHRIGWL
jgi:hypothetical protein